MNMLMQFLIAVAVTLTFFSLAGFIARVAERRERNRNVIKAKPAEDSRSSIAAHKRIIDAPGLRRQAF